MYKKIITITINQELNKKLRSIQIKMIREKNASVSLSAVIDKTLHAGLNVVSVEGLKKEKNK